MHALDDERHSMFECPALEYLHVDTVQAARKQLFNVTVAYAVTTVHAGFHDPQGPACCLVNFIDCLSLKP